MEHEGGQRSFHAKGTGRASADRAAKGDYPFRVHVRPAGKRVKCGYGRGGRMKIEQDKAEILSGVRHGLTIGSPISLFIRNRDWENWREAMSPAAPETDEPAPVAYTLALAPPMPNPARGTTRFSFDLPRAMSARLEVLDVQGRLVATLAEGELGAGRHERAWDGTTARGRAAGLYFVRLQTPEGRLVRRVVVLD